MWMSLLKSAEWKPFKDLLSPSFFDVVPATVLLGQASALARNYRDGPQFEAAKAARSSTLVASGLPVSLAPTLPTARAAMDPQRRGALVLELYFHQVLKGGGVLLDHRSTAFAEQGDRLVWSPPPVFATFDPDFHAGLTQLYRGFYASDPAAFSAGAAMLGLGKAEDAMRKQFGADDQTRVVFSLREFQHRFHDVFVECKATKSKLHPQFIALGIGLSTLYSHLEELGGTHDARGAFERAAGMPTA